MMKWLAIRHQGLDFLVKMEWVFGFIGIAPAYKSGFFGPSGAETVSGGAGSSFSSFIGSASNSSIGMPDTVNTKNIADRNGFLSKAYFKEYQVKSGKPLTVLASFSDVSGWYCKKRVAFSFVPKPGKDYEGAMNVSFADRTCRFQLKELQATEGVAELKEIDDLHEASKCD